MNLNYEQKLLKSKVKYFCSVDEVGRGAWAGPIVAAAVLVNKKDLTKWQATIWFKLVRDSKLLSPTKRELIFKQCHRQVTYSLGIVNNKIIDKIGIGEANRLAVKLAVQKLSPQPQVVLCDYVGGLKSDYLARPLLESEPRSRRPARQGLQLQNIIDGDAKVFSIALASVLAKVSRDRMMMNLDKKYPEYAFGEHKGYGTAEHISALVKYGVSDVHRRSYKPVKYVENKESRIKNHEC